MQCSLRERHPEMKPIVNAFLSKPVKASMLFKTVVSTLRRKERQSSGADSPTWSDIYAASPVAPAQRLQSLAMLPGGGLQGSLIRHALGLATAPAALGTSPHAPAPSILSKKRATEFMRSQQNEPGPDGAMSPASGSEQTGGSHGPGKAR